MRPRFLLGAAGAIVLGVVALAIGVLDSPAEARRQRLDAQRVSDLAGLTNAIDSYWESKHALPSSTEDPGLYRYRNRPTSDPETGTPYRYRITGERSYELCASFSTGTPEHTRRDHRVLWNHAAGEKCFALEVEEKAR